MNARIAFLLLAVVLAPPVAAQTFPQNFPSRPVRIIVVYPPGGTSDAVPTLTERGYADANDTSHFGFFAPARTPDAALKRLHADINAALALPDVVERLTKLDNVVAASTQEQFAQVVRREYEANAKVVAKAGIRSE